MSSHIQHPLASEDIPAEFVRSAIGYLDCAEKLNALMVTGSWQSSFHRGQPILWLTFHSIELFLKACILQVDPSETVSGHELPKLRDTLCAKVPGLSFEIPFQAEPFEPLQCRFQPPLSSGVQRNWKLWRQLAEQNWIEGSPEHHISQHQLQLSGWCGHAE